MQLGVLAFSQLVNTTFLAFVEYIGCFVLTAGIGLPAVNKLLKHEEQMEITVSLQANPNG